MKRLLTFAAIFVFSLLSQFSSAQEPAKPGPEHDILKEMVGTWDAVLSMAGTPKEAASKGKSVYKMELGGLWLTSSFEGDFGGAKFEGRGIDGYDQFKKKYTGVWVDSMSSTPMFFEGTRDEKTKILTMTTEHPGPDGKLAKWKSQSSSKDKDHHTFKMFIIGEGGKDEEMFTIEYTRKK
ncbi:MAG: DUF1579 domain-containing protein [Pirellulaceae bacterium]